MQMRAVSPVAVMTATDDPMAQITANNLDMTDAMRDYVQDKIGSVVNKYGSLVSRCDTHLSVINNPRVTESDTCEVVVFSKGVVIRAAERSESMYSSIDLVAAKLGRKLRKLKERKFGSKSSHKAPRTQEVVEDTLDDVDVGEEPVDLSQLVRRKRFPMPAQSVNDALVCLEYIDHDFYVFRNEETNEVNVIYKRREGGIGLIEPDN